MLRLWSSFRWDEKGFWIQCRNKSLRKLKRQKWWICSSVHCKHFRNLITQNFTKTLAKISSPNNFHLSFHKKLKNYWSLPNFRACCQCSTLHSLFSVLFSPSSHIFCNWSSFAFSRYMLCESIDSQCFVFKITGLWRVPLSRKAKREANWLPVKVLNLAGLSAEINVVRWYHHWTCSFKPVQKINAIQFVDEERKV